MYSRFQSPGFRILQARISLAWENSRHLSTLPLVFPPNGVWETSAEISYWCRVTTQIWVVLLIGRAAWEIWFNQSEALPRRHQYGISALVSQTSFGEKASGSVAKCRLFSQAKIYRISWIRIPLLGATADPILSSLNTMSSSGSISHKHIWSIVGVCQCDETLTNSGPHFLIASNGSC